MAKTETGDFEIAEGVELSDELLGQIAGGELPHRIEKMIRRDATRTKNAGGSKEGFIEKLTAAGYSCDRADVKAVIDKVFDQS